jgi:two-component system sensor kinase FixL
VEGLGSEAYLRSILDSVPDAMVVIDDAGLILSFSATAERMFGFTEAELIGENVSTLMPSPDRERHDRYLSRYLATNERRMIGIGRIASARRRDGTMFPVDLSIGEAHIGDKRVFTGFIRDLTETQNIQMRLHEVQDELAHVSRVTAMGALAASIAHEINQPLTAIANYVETVGAMLAAPEPDQLPMIREALEDCAKQTIRAGQIVRRLRDFISRGETDRQIVGLERLISEASALAFVGAGGPPVDFTVQVEPGDAQVLVDRIQIQQVLVNLIRNAVEAMENLPLPRLEITCQRTDDGMLLVSTDDSGPGLAAGMDERLFEPFCSTKSTGMGLGLSICRTIIEGHGGKIWAEPSPLGGLALKFSLPEVFREVEIEQGT